MSAQAAANPATSAARLAQLADKYPADVLRNPVLPLLLLEQPDWLTRLPAAALVALLHQSGSPATEAPALLVAAGASPHPLLRLVLATHPATTASQVAQLARDANPAVRHAARCRAGAALPADPSTALRDAVLLGLPPYAPIESPYSYELVEALVQLPGVVPTARLQWLRQAISTGLRVEQPAGAASFRPPYERLYFAATQAHISPELPAIANPLTPPTQLAQLAQAAADQSLITQTPDSNSLLLLARNPATPPALLLWLYVHFVPDRVEPAPGDSADEPLPPLRHWLPELPLRTVSPVFHLRPRTLLPPPAELRELLIASPVLPLALRQLLATYPHPLPALVDNWPGLTEELPAVLAAHPAVPPAMLALLAASSDHAARLPLQRALAANPHTPTELLVELAASRSLDIARCALHNPAYPAPTPADHTEPARRWSATHRLSPSELARLAADKAGAVRTLVAENPATPPATLTQLSTDRLGAVRAATAAHPATPVTTLAQLAQDPDTLVVRVVAGHPAAPPALVGELARHTNKFVRRAALANPNLPSALLPKLVKEKSLENRLLLLHREDGRRALLRQLADHSPAAALLVHLLLPGMLTPAHHAALATSPNPGHRLAVAARPEFAGQLRDDPHLLVRLVARGELADPTLELP